MSTNRLITRLWTTQENNDIELIRHSTAAQDHNLVTQGYYHPRAFKPSLEVIYPNIEAAPEVSVKPTKR